MRIIQLGIFICAHWIPRCHEFLINIFHIKRNFVSHTEMKSNGLINCLHSEWVNDSMEFNHLTYHDCIHGIRLSYRELMITNPLTSHMIEEADFDTGPIATPACNNIQWVKHLILNADYNEGAHVEEIIFRALIKTRINNTSSRVANVCYPMCASFHKLHPF